MMRSSNPAARTIAPRQKRARQTRATLLRAVEGIVAAEDADAVTTTRVASVTGLSVGTIYRYFADRESLLLAAYDATVARIVETCRETLADLDSGRPAADAARQLLRAYLDAAEAIPAHAGLLRAMRAIRPAEPDQGGNETAIMDDLLAPFMRKYSGAAAPDPARIHFMNVLLGTLVDLYLVTADAGERKRLRAELEAHMLLALERSLAHRYEKRDPDFE